MGGQLEKIKEEMLGQTESSEALKKLNDVRVSYLGKREELTDLLESMKDVAPEGRPKVGQMVSDVRRLIEGRLEEAKTALTKKARKEQLKRKIINVTLPARKNNMGHNHPSTTALEEVEHTFVGIGYEVVEGPEMECNRYNSGKLNISKGHPVKDEQDTFHIDENILLCSQTSPVQVRIMEQDKLPIRMTVPGRMFHSDGVDATHSPSPHQIEGFMIGKNITFADLKGVLAEFVRELLGPETRVKPRPHYSPSTEPGAGVDVTCFECGSSGYRFCKGSDWIKILGYGMVYPHVLEIYGISPDTYSGLTFGMGLECTALFKYKADDIRPLHENDICFLKQF